MKDALIWLGIWLPVLALALFGIRPKRNRRTGLPPPSDLCRRAPDWRNAELQTPRKYVP